QKQRQELGKLLPFWEFANQVAVEARKLLKHHPFFARPPSQPTMDCVFTDPAHDGESSLKFAWTITPMSGRSTSCYDFRQVIANHSVL
ncbi:unnamed protein product, partial [Urochloa humidicola]